MAQDGGELGQAGVEDVALIIGFVKVHVRAADAAGLNFQQHVLGAGSGVGPIAHLKGGIAPDAVAGDGFARLLFPFRDGIIWLGVPFCVEH